MHATTATCTTTASATNSSYASTSYHPSTYIQRIPIPEDYYTTPLHPPSSHKHTSNDPIILPPLPAYSNPALTAPHVNRAGQASRPTSLARRAQTTSPSHLSRSERISSSSLHPYTKPSSPSHPSRSAPSSPPRRPQYNPTLHHSDKPTLDHSDKSTSEPTEPDPAQALNDLHYLSSLTAAQRAELYRRSRLPSSSSSSELGWFSYLPSILNTLKSRLPTTSAHTTPSSRPSPPSTLPSLPPLPTFESYNTLTHLLTSERLENAKLKRACEVLKRQVREVSARCCALEALGFAGSGVAVGRSVVEGGLGKNGKGKRGVKRRREDSEEGKRTSPSPTARHSTPAAGKSKTKTGVPRKSSSPPVPRLRSPISLSGSCASAGSSGTSSTLTPTSSTSRTSTPSSLGLGLTLKPLRYDDDDISDTESLPTPSYLPIPFLSQQSRSSVPAAKSLYDTLVKNEDTKVIQTAPATPEGQSTILDRPPTPPKRVRSAGGRIQSRAKVVKLKSTYPTVAEEAFEITPSPSPATAVDEDEEQEKEKVRKRRLLDLMFVNTGREIECRACRINTTYPRIHTKHIPISQIHTFIHGTSEQEYFAHLSSKHAAEWGELKRLSEREVGLLRGRLGIPESERREEKGGYMDLTTGKYVRDVCVEEDVGGVVGRVERVDDVPEVRPRWVDIAPSHLMMRMAAAKQREGLGMVNSVRGWFEC